MNGGGNDGGINVGILSLVGGMSDGGGVDGKGESVSAAGCDGDTDSIGLW